MLTTNRHRRPLKNLLSVILPLILMACGGDDSAEPLPQNETTERVSNPSVTTTDPSAPDPLAPVPSSSPTNAQSTVSPIQSKSPSPTPIKTPTAVPTAAPGAPTKSPTAAPIAPTATTITTKPTATRVPTRTPSTNLIHSNGKLKIFILAGQSNMVGHGKVELGGDANGRKGYVIGGVGSLRAMVNKNPIKYGYLVDQRQLITYPSFPGAITYPGWVTRNDTWVSYWSGLSAGVAAESRNGALSVGFGVANRLPEGFVGPEIGFGHIVGNALEDKVLLIKTAWGGKSLAVDFRPPSSAMNHGGVVGPYYLQMISIVRSVLSDIPRYNPDYKGQGYELAGFGWHQGWNDRINESFVNEYEVNLVNLIRDFRKELKAPKMPVVIANTGMADANQSPVALNLIAAQQNVSDKQKYPEFTGTVATVDTRPFDYGLNSPDPDSGYHWNNSGESYFHIGEKMGEEMLRLMSLHLVATPSPSTVPTTPSPSKVPTATPVVVATPRPTATPQPNMFGGTAPAGYTFCANESEICVLPALSDVAFGANGRFSYLKRQKGNVKLYSDTFSGDPAPNVRKSGYYKLIDLSLDAEAVTSVLDKIDAHIGGTQVLPAAEINRQIAVLQERKGTIGYNDKLISKAWSIVNRYETQIGPLFMNGRTKGGFANNFIATDGFELERAVFNIQQELHDFGFTAQNLAKYEALLTGKIFQTSKYFPGDCPPPTDKDRSYIAKINATLSEEWGKPTAFGKTPARRPTGYYLAPGSVGIVTVPAALVNKGFEVLVGAHTSDVSSKSQNMRLFRVTKSFPITNAETKIANPFGGGVYIVTPYQASAGLVDVTLKNVVPAPLFSSTSAKKTTLADWLDAQRHHSAPWADFVTDKFMMQVPTSWIYNYADPVALMTDWDLRMDAISQLFGYPLLRNNISLYVQVDATSMYDGYAGIGYPQVNEAYRPLDATNGNSRHWFLTPGKNFSQTEFHEMGHAQLFSKFPGYQEADVNILAAYLFNTKYGDDIDTALANAFMVGNYTRDQSAINWMVTPNFRAGKPMDISNTEKDEVRYQQRGYAYMVEIAALFGWKVWEQFFHQEHLDYMAKKPSDGLHEIDSRILRLSQKAGFDLRPLLHFWGIHPVNDMSLSTALNSAALKPSAKIYDRLVYYKSIIPLTNDQFKVHAQLVQPKSLNASSANLNPNYGDGWYYYWSSRYDNTHGSAAVSAMQNTIIDRYFPKGRP